MNSKKIAIDVVLELPREIVDLSIKINKNLIEKYGKKIELKRNEEVPHITLAFANINEKDLPKVIEKVNSLSSQLNRQYCELTNFKGDDKRSSFEVLVEEELLNFRDELIGFLKTFHNKEVSKEDFFQTGAEIKEEHLDWVKNYLYKSTYWAHISLGKGDIETYVDFPLDFICEKVAIYHLGYNCTCQKKLAEFELI